MTDENADNGRTRCCCDKFRPLHDCLWFCSAINHQLLIVETNSTSLQIHSKMCCWWKHRSGAHSSPDRCHVTRRQPISERAETQRGDLLQRPNGDDDHSCNGHRSTTTTLWILATTTESIVTTTTAAAAAAATASWKVDSNWLNDRPMALTASFSVSFHLHTPSLYNLYFLHILSS